MFTQSKGIQVILQASYVFLLSHKVLIKSRTHYCPEQDIGSGRIIAKLVIGVKEYKL